MRLEHLLYRFGFRKCMVLAIQKADKRIVSDADFNIESHIKEGISRGIAKEIAKREDLIQSDGYGDGFYYVYRAEIFVFSREELKELIKRLTEGR